MSDNPTVMVTVYGKPKKKKTSDVLAAFPTALCIGVPSAITLVAQNELGFTPAVHPEPPQTLPELVTLLDYVSRTGMAKQYGAIVIDDASHICDRSMMVWNEEAPAGKSGKKDKFYAFQQLNKYLLMLSGLARHMGVHLAFTFHERMPGTNADGFFCPGGPNVPSRNQVETLPSWCPAPTPTGSSAPAARTCRAAIRWRRCRPGATSTCARWSTRPTPTRGSLACTSAIPRTPSG